MWSPTERPHKHEIRHFVLDGLGWRRRSLWLPGADLMCLKTALELGVLDDRSDIIAIEREPEVADIIGKALPRLGVGWHLHRGELHDLELPDLRLNYAFLDFLGCLNTPIAEWMTTQLASHMAKDFSLAITLAYAPRGSQMMRKAGKLFATQYRDLYRDFLDEIGIYKSNVTLPMALLKSVFRDYTFKFNWSAKYRDSVQSMCVYRLTDFKPVSCPTWPHIRNFYVETTPGAITPPREAPNKWRLAGLKAWETRRLNAR